MKHLATCHPQHLTFNGHCLNCGMNAPKNTPQTTEERKQKLQALGFTFPETIIDDYGDNVTEARLLPTGGGGNIICGKHGYLMEMSFRRERNKTLDDSAKFLLPAWDSLKIYGAE